MSLPVEQARRDQWPWGAHERRFGFWAWDAAKVVSALKQGGETVSSVDALIARLRELVREGDHLVFMSNGGFEGAPRRALAALGE